LIAIVRRIDSSGNGLLEYHEFKSLCEPTVLKISDVLLVEDTGSHIKGQPDQRDSRFGGPLIRSKNYTYSSNASMANVIQPFGSNLNDNLAIYDNIMSNSPERGSVSYADVGTD